jgi:hypothetical protein
MRDAMVKHGLLNKLIPLLQDHNHFLVVVGVMYQLSLDDNTRSLFAFVDIIPLVIFTSWRKFLSLTHRVANVDDFPI